MPPTKKPIDEELVKKLAMIHCTYEEMASIVGVSRDLLYRRCKTIIEDARNHGRMSIRRKRFEVAMQGNVQMLIWLSRTMLGETDNSLLEMSGRQQITLPKGDVDALVKLAKRTYTSEQSSQSVAA